MKKFTEVKMKNTITLVYLSFFTVVLVSSLVLNYMNIYDLENNKLESELKQAVLETNNLLSQTDFFERATEKSSISKQEDCKNTKKLSMMLKSSSTFKDIIYVYSFIITKDFNVIYTSSSATDEELLNNKCFPYFINYEEATPKLKNIFENNKAFFEVSTDDDGTFKSFLRPFEAKNGVKYIVGADITLSVVNEKFNKIIIFELLLFLVAFTGGVLFFYISQKNVRTINHLIFRILNMSKLDDLTNLFNKKTFYEIANDTISQSSMNLSLLMVDIDFFKKINDTYGHIFGDKVLKVVAEELGKNIRDTDILARFGGEEFIILLPDFNESKSYMLAEKLRKSIESLRIENTEFGTIKITASIGLSQYIEGDNLDTFIHNSDIALYEAKNSGRNRVEIFKI